MGASLPAGSDRQLVERHDPNGQLGNLSNLEWLILSNNNALSGAIPSQLGNLTNLTWLYP